jgi:hypothetical protein
VGVHVEQACSEFESGGGQKFFEKKALGSYWYCGHVNKKNKRRCQKNLSVLFEVRLSIIVATLCDSISHRLTLTVVIGIAGTSTKKTREGAKKTFVFLCI